MISNEKDSILLTVPKRKGHATPCGEEQGAQREAPGFCHKADGKGKTTDKNLNCGVCRRNG